MMRWCWPLLALLPLGCGVDEALESAATPDAGADVELDAAPSSEAGPPIRSVERRNPFGRTELTHNLLVDGDFELTSSNGQFGWRAFQAGAETSLVRETGGLCRSGVTCAMVKGGSSLIALAAAPADQSMEISVWAKPDDGDCASGVVSLVSCTGLIPQNLGAVPAESDTPDPSGWCHYFAKSPPTNLQPCLLVSFYADAERRMLVDDASILAAAGTPPSSVLAEPPDAERYERAKQALRILHEHQRFGRPGPASP